MSQKCIVIQPHVRDGENRPDAVQYMELVPLLLQQWKAQREVNAALDGGSLR